MLKISTYSDKKDMLNNLLMVFLILAIALPAYIFKPYQYFDIFYWKAAALYVCVSILVLLGIFKIVISKEKITAEQIYSIMPVIAYMIAVIISTFLSKYSDEAIWGERLFHEGTITLLCYGLIFIASRFIVNNNARFNIIIYSTWITAGIIIIDSIFKYDAALRSTFYEMLVYSLLFIVFKYFIPKNIRNTKAVKYTWITALILFIDAGLKAVISGDLQCSINDGGSFTHRNYLSSYFTLIFLPAAAGYFYSNKKKTNLLFFLLSCTFFTVLILNHTRSAWVGNAIGLVLLIILGRKKITLKKLSTLLISFIIIVFAVNTFSQGLIFT
ncbi:MAG: O-antigen ligase family protein, partial [Deltaproteobacteria bacterium]